MIKINGKVIDDETRCEHYASKKDIIAIKFYCCEKYYPCYKCHEESVAHQIKAWPKEKFTEEAIFCGLCKNELSIDTYLNQQTCPHCSAAFNENCRFHGSIYFDL